MVHSVLAIPSVGKTKRDFRNMQDGHFQKNQKSGSFSDVLTEKLTEQNAAPRACQTITYGHDSMLHLFQYQTREYHY